MSDWFELLLGLLVILNPLGALMIWRSLSEQLPPESRMRLGVFAGLVALVLLALTVLLADPVLDALDVSVPTWKIAAGLLLIFGVAATIVRRDPFAREPFGSPRGAPLWAVARMALNLATPATAAALVYFGASRGRAQVLSSLAVAFVVVIGCIVAARRLESPGARVQVREVGRAVAAIVVVIGVALIVDGINSV